MTEPTNSNTYIEVQRPHVAWVNGHAFGDWFALCMGTFEQFLSRYKIRGEDAKYTVYAYLSLEQATTLRDRLTKFINEGE